MNKGYFSPENMKIAPVNYPLNYIEHSLNVYKIAPVKPNSCKKKSILTLVTCLAKLSPNLYIFHVNMEIPT